MGNPELQNPETIDGLQIEVMSDALHLAAYATPTQARDATWQVTKESSMTVLRQADMGAALENAIFTTSEGLIVSSIHACKGGFIDREEDAAQRAVLLRYGAEPRIFRTNFTPDNWRHNFKKLQIDHGQHILPQIMTDDNLSFVASIDELAKTKELLRHLLQDLSTQEIPMSPRRHRKFGIFPVRAV